MKLSVLLPVFNEEVELQACLDRVLASPVVAQVVAVDDCSTDSSSEILGRCHDGRLKVICHERNLGKGGAIRTALEHVTEPVVIIQDADTEYDPCDYVRLLEPLAKGQTDVVYGARDTSTQPLIGHLGNKFLTVMTNLLTGTRLSDMETCYKLVPTELMRSLKLRSRGFEIEPEITAKLARRNARFAEVPISYAPRRAKKLHRLRDGTRSLWALFKYRFVD